MLDRAETRAAESSPVADRRDRLFQDGIVAGAIGAGTIAIWFLILDTVAGRPLYTPTLLGTALFRPNDLAGLLKAGTALSFDMVLTYTWVHGLVFCVLGGIASWLLTLAEKNPNLGFGVLLLFVVFEFGFLVVTMLFAAPILGALTWPAILVGNLLAAGAMAGYFWRRHPNLTIWP